MVRLIQKPIRNRNFDFSILYTLNPSAKMRFDKNKYITHSSYIQTLIQGIY